MDKKSEEEDEEKETQDKVSITKTRWSKPSGSPLYLYHWFYEELQHLQPKYVPSIHVSFFMEENSMVLQYTLSMIADDRTYWFPRDALLSPH